MPRLCRLITLLLTIAMVLPLNSRSATVARADGPTVHANMAIPTALSILVQPAKINIGRDVRLRVAVMGRNRKSVAALVSVTGAGNPSIGTATHGTFTITVHAIALGFATVQASLGGYSPAIVRIPIIAGPPASVMAVKRGLSLQAPHAKPRPGTVGNDLFQDYHAITARTQLASLGLRDGTLVDLNSNTDVLIKDPLHTVLNNGELFMEVVHGAVSHQVQAGTAVAATKGTRLDVRFIRSTHTAIVTVVEGRVLVTNKNRSQLVGAGQQTTVSANRPPTAPRQINLPAVVGWVKAVPNSSSAVVPPIFAIPPAPPMTIPTTSGGRTPNLTLTGTLVTTSVSGVVLITGTATLPVGATLTVAPGTLVEFGPGALLQVDGALRATGTAGAPITMTSSAANPTPGDWQTLRIEGPGASATILDYVRAFYGGGDSYYGTPGMVLVRAGAAITVRNSFFGSANGAIYVDDGSRPTITNCSFSGDSGSPINAPVDLFGQISEIHLAPGQDPVVARPGTISVTATWLREDVPLVITGTVALAAKTRLTIAPGSVIAFGPGALLQVDGTLSAVGTAAAPITFTSAAAQPKPGDWQALRVEGADASKSAFDHVQFFYGGFDRYYGTPGELLIRTSANISVKNSLFAQDSNGAIYVDDGSRPVIGDCLFAGDAGSPINAGVDAQSSFTHNHLAAGQAPIVARAGTISTSATWIPADAPIVLTGTVTLAAGTTLTIDPGTVITFGPGALFEIDGTLKADGTADAPITFTSAAAQPRPGDWQTLRIEGAAARATSLHNVQILYGGYDQYYGVPGMLLIRAGADISVDNAVLSYDSRGAMHIDDGTRPRISNTLFSDDVGSPLDAGVDQLSLFTNLQFGAGQAPIVVRSGTISSSQIWQPTEPPVVLTGTVTLAAGVTLTIAAGTTLQLGPGALLEVDGTLHAAGSADHPITFTSASATPRPGDWQTIRIEGTAAANTVLDYVHVSYGGHDGYYGSPGMVLIRAGAAVKISRSAFAHGANGGIYVDSDTQAAITGNSFSDIVGPAVLTSAADQPLVRNNTFGPGQKQVEIHT